MKLLLVPLLVILPDLHERVQQIAEDALDGGADAVSVAVEREGVVLLARGWGEAGAEPASAVTPYPAGGFADAWVACVVAALAEDGKLALDDPVSKYLPEQRLDERITIEDLLAHTSGLADVNELAHEKAAGIRAEDVVAWLAGRPLVSEPGTETRYNAADSLVLARVVAEVTERPGREVLQRRVLGPAGMVLALPCGEAGPDESVQQRVTHETPSGVHVDVGVPLPFEMGTLCATARDVADWTRALVDQRLVGDASTKELRARVFEAGSLGGFDRLTLGGGVGDSSMHVSYYPLLDLIVAVGVRGERADAAEIARRISAYLLRLPDAVVLDLPTTAEDRAVYAGYYKLGSSAYRILDVDGRLLVEPPTQDAFALLYQGDDVFVAKDDLGVRLEFHVRDGSAYEFVLVRDGTRSVAERFDAPRVVELSSAQASPFSLASQ